MDLNVFESTVNSISQWRWIEQARRKGGWDSVG